jgi:hypothetical protein
MEKVVPVAELLEQVTQSVRHVVVEEELHSEAMVFPPRTPSERTI